MKIIIDNSPQTRLAHLFCPGNIEKARVMLLRAAAKAKKLGYPYPKTITLTFRDDSSLTGAASVGSVKDIRGIDGPLVELTTGLLICGSMHALEGLVVHEFSHLVDTARQAKEIGVNTDLTDNRGYQLHKVAALARNQQVEYAAIRLSLQLIDDPWKILEFYMENAKRKITPTGNAFSDMASKRIVSAGTRTHPSLRNVIHEVKTFAERNGFPMRDDLLREAYQIHSFALNRTKNNGKSWQL